MKIEFAYEFESAHRLTKSDSTKCQTPHGHSWEIVLSIGSHAKHLDHKDMLVEFADIKSIWKSFVYETLDHSFFYNINDPVAEKLIQLIPSFRGLPFPADPTTEMIAGLCFLKAMRVIEHINKDKSQSLYVESILIKETSTNKVLLNHDSAIVGYFKEKYLNAKFIKNKAWWTDNNSNTRKL